MRRLRMALATAAVLAAASCGPDFVYDNPCDPASPATYDPCLCTGCTASTCEARKAGEGPDTCGCRSGAVACGASGDAGVTACCEMGDVCLAATATCCTPTCGGRQCGDDGCGGTCGTCDEAGGYGCVDFQCLFTACDGKECGDNGHGGSCGQCPDGKACSDAGQCVAGS